MPNDLTDSISNFLFGKGALKKAADSGAPTPTPAPTTPAYSMSQIAAQAQKQADLQRQADANAKLPSGHANVVNPGSHADKMAHE